MKLNAIVSMFLRRKAGPMSGSMLKITSPCTEEIAVVPAFSRVIREAGKRFVVMDTAPTGHTLLLFDARVSKPSPQNAAEDVGIAVILPPG
jgi:anion-transporting  ArsA/GET3 family ATPase